MAFFNFGIRFKIAAYKLVNEKKWSSFTYLGFQHISAYSVWITYSLCPAVIKFFPLKLHSCFCDITLALIAFIGCRWVSARDVFFNHFNFQPCFRQRVCLLSEISELYGTTYSICQQQLNAVLISSIETWNDIRINLCTYKIFCFFTFQQFATFWHKYTLKIKKLKITQPENVCLIKMNE